MNILILGATGFIGNSIFQSLVSDYNVTIAGRSPIDGYNKWLPVDFLKDNDWDELLEGFDLVINAIGIIEGDFKKVQTEAPLKIYNACVKRNIRVLHISAVGAEKETPSTPFLRSKKVTDDFLLGYNNAKVIYPGIVIGKRGISTQFFTEIAQFPIIPLFSDKPVPLVHINQLTDLIKLMVKDFDNYPNQVFAVAKPEPLSRLFTALKGKQGRFIKMPEFLFNILFTLFPWASVGIFNKDTFKMFRDTSNTHYEPMFEEASQYIKPKQLIKGDYFPQLFALLAISFIWLWSGISSLISWDESYSIMQEIGANHPLSILFICLGCFADIVLGFAIFSKKHRKKVIIAQVLIMTIYMIILSVFAPHYWLHPFGVLSKNIPLIALSYYLYQKEE